DQFRRCADRSVDQVVRMSPQWLGGIQPSLNVGVEGATVEGCNRNGLFLPTRPVARCGRGNADKLGRIVIADCVNPVLASRAGLRQTALQNSARMVEIEVVCSDLALHRQRVESRSPDIAGLKLPTWDEVVNRSYETWDREHLVLDTADRSFDHLLERAGAYVRDKID